MIEKNKIKIVWASDIHLDHCNEQNKERFFDDIKSHSPNFLFLTGDISNGTEIQSDLIHLQKHINCPVYFVLGNHDFYESSIQKVNFLMNDLKNISDQFHWLTNESFLSLTKNTAIVGHDCWYDAKNGLAMPSKFVMSDWFLIEDFVKYSGGRSFYYYSRALNDEQGLIMFVQALAQKGVNHITKQINDAISANHKKIIVLTHYPPFKKSHIFQGNIGDELSQPWFTNKTLGDALMTFAKNHSDVEFNVLCGHTHGQCMHSPLKNLHVYVAGAEYRIPQIAGVLEEEEV